MYRIAIARLFQETSSFSPKKTTIDDFQQFGLHFGKEILDKVSDLRDEIGGFVEVANETGDMELIPVMWAVGWTGGALTHDTFAYLKEQLVSRIQAITDLDGVLLALHGSMASELVDDTEGDILSALRAVIGNIPMVAAFDHHANMTRRIVDNVDALVAYRHCPHSDTFETGVRAARLLRQILRQEVRPTMAFRKIPMVTPADRFETGKPPLQLWFDAAREMEREPAVLAVSQFPVQPWMDVAEYGWSVVVATDSQQALADTLSNRLAQQAWDMRNEFQVSNPTAAEAVRMALSTDGPVVLADGADATNGGAPGDSTILLEELIRQNTDKRCCLTVVDPDVVEQALRAGIGSRITVDLGGKQDPENSRPLRVTGSVTAQSDGRFRILGGSHHAISVDMGRTIVLEIGNIQVVVCEKLNPGHDPLVYQHIGIEPKDTHVIVVKCVVGHVDAYKEITTKTIWTDCPGATPSNLLRLAHNRIARPMFPFDLEMDWVAASP